jgi:hypothetical protein
MPLCAAATLQLVRLGVGSALAVPACVVGVVPCSHSGCNRIASSVVGRG